VANRDGRPIPFLDELQAWHERYSAEGGRRRVRVEFEEWQDDSPKRMAAIRVRARAAEGELLLWESGECETQAFGTDSTGEIVPLLLRSRVLSDKDVVAVVADDLVDHVADYSGT
jgi:hypothetical protein